MVVTFLEAYFKEVALKYRTDLLNYELRNVDKMNYGLSFQEVIDYPLAFSNFT